MLSVCKIIFCMVPINAIHCVYTNIYLFGLFVISNYSKGRVILDFGAGTYIALMALVGILKEGEVYNFPTSGHVHRGELLKYIKI